MARQHSILCPAELLAPILRVWNNSMLGGYCVAEMGDEPRNLLGKILSFREATVSKLASVCAEEEKVASERVAAVVLKTIPYIRGLSTHTRMIVCEYILGDIGEWQVPIPIPRPHAFSVPERVLGSFIAPHRMIRLHRDFAAEATREQRIYNTARRYDGWLEVEHMRVQAVVNRLLERAGIPDELLTFYRQENKVVIWIV